MTTAINAIDPRQVYDQVRATPSLEAARKLQGQKNAQEDPRLDKALIEFQNVLWDQMMKAMREATPENALFGKSTGEEVFESMLDQEYAKAMGEGMGGLGLTETLKWQLGLMDQAAAPKAEDA